MTKSTDVHELLTVPETAAHLKCSKNTVYNLINAGKLRWVNIGSRKTPRTRIRVGDLTDFIDQQTHGAASGSRAS